MCVVCRREGGSEGKKERKKEERTEIERIHLFTLSSTGWMASHYAAMKQPNLGALTLVSSPRSTPMAASYTSLEE